MGDNKGVPGKKNRWSEWWLYSLLVLPILTQFVETNNWPRAPRELITEAGLTLCIGMLVVALHRRNRRLISLGETDPLTGLLNRRKFEADLKREVARAQRMGTPLALAFLDMDRFKMINDTYGHNEGDRVLKQVARVLCASVRSDVDSCYRIGGDEFALIMPGVQARENGWIDAKISRAAQLLEVRGAALSVGVALLTRNETPEELMRRADHLMYEKKREERKMAETESSSLSALPF